MFTANAITHDAHCVESEKIIYLINHGWHAGIVIKRADFSAKVWPESNDFKGFYYIEVGWGDKDFYQTPTPGIGITVKAALWPTDSVLHLVGFNGSVTSYFALSEIVEIRISNDGFERLIRYFAASHLKNGNEMSKPIAKGLYGNSYFYLSKETYHLFKTCNTWTAEALNVAGVSINSDLTASVEQLMTQAKEVGTVIQKNDVD